MRCERLGQPVTTICRREERLTPSPREMVTARWVWVTMGSLVCRLMRRLMEMYRGITSKSFRIRMSFWEHLWLCISQLQSIRKTQRKVSWKLSWKHRRIQMLHRRLKYRQKYRRSRRKLRWLKLWTLDKPHRLWARLWLAEGTSLKTQDLTMILIHLPAKTIVTQMLRNKKMTSQSLTLKLWKARSKLRSRWLMRRQKQRVSLSCRACKQREDSHLTKLVKALMVTERQ